MKQEDLSQIKKCSATIKVLEESAIKYLTSTIPLSQIIKDKKSPFKITFKK